MKESSIWDWITRNRHIAGESFHAFRVENKLGRGTPDMAGAFCSYGFWAENKALHGVSKCGTSGRIHFQEGQREFAVRHWRTGAWSLIMVRMGREIFVIPGGRAMEFPEDGIVTRYDLAKYDLLREKTSDLKFLSAEVFKDFLKVLTGQKPEIELPPIEGVFSPEFMALLRDDDEDLDL